MMIPDFAGNITKEEVNKFYRGFLKNVLNDYIPTTIDCVDVEQEKKNISVGSKKYNATQIKISDTKFLVNNDCGLNDKITFNLDSFEMNVDIPKDEESKYLKLFKVDTVEELKDKCDLLWRRFLYKKFRSEYTMYFTAVRMQTEEIKIKKEVKEIKKDDNYGKVVVSKLNQDIQM